MDYFQGGRVGVRWEWEEDSDGDVAEGLCWGWEEDVGYSLEGREVLLFLISWWSLGICIMYDSNMKRWVNNLLSSTAFHNPAESSFDKLMMPLAVPFRRKSASLTLLINASFITNPSGSRRTSSSSGQSLKCKVRRQGRKSVVRSALLEAGSAPA